MDEAERISLPLAVLALPMVVVMAALAVVAAALWYILAALWGACDLFVNLAKPVGATPHPALRGPHSRLRFLRIMRFKHGDQQRKRSHD